MTAVRFVSTLAGLLAAAFAGAAAVTWAVLTVAVEVARWLGLVDDDQEPP